jgi:hypothetical protein
MASCRSGPEIEEASFVTGVEAEPDAALAPGAPDGGFSSLGFEVTFADEGHRPLAVTGGTILAIDLAAGATAVLSASDDGGVSWSTRGKSPMGAMFKVISVLPSGTLMADLAVTDTHHLLARSTDGGASWVTALDLGVYRMLQPHSVGALDGAVYYGEYQVYTTSDVPVRLWRSVDDGASWSVRYTFTGRRHVHSLVADTANHALWALLGDTDGGVLRSTDGGASFTALVDGWPGVAVDATVVGSRLLYGNDALYRPAEPRVAWLGCDGRLEPGMDLPGPSYSILPLPGGGWLMGETRESGGDVYAFGDVSAHLFGSVDGDRWDELLSTARLSSNKDAGIDPRWILPSGEVVIALSEVTMAGPSGAGFLRARVVGR